MRVGHQLRQAMADEPLRSAAHHPATARDSNQRVNGRLADLGEEATARRSGAQGVYPSHYNNDHQLNFNDNQYGNNQYGVNQYMTHPSKNQYISQMQHFPGNHSQGEFPSMPMKRISSGRDRTGNDGIARLFVPWPNEHCLIGIDRRKVKYDQSTQAQWLSGLLNILAMERDPLCRKTMLNHITRLSQDVVDCGCGQGCACGGFGGPRGGKGELDGARGDRSHPTRRLSQGCTSRTKAPVAHHSLQGPPPCKT